MKTEAIDRFWENYINKTKTDNVPTPSIRWYVKRVEEFIKAHPTIQLAQHTVQTVQSYREKLGRNPRLEDWQFKQAVDALKILFVARVRTDWASQFPWHDWIESAAGLEPSHATVARDNHRPVSSNYSAPQSNGGDTVVLSTSDNRLINKVRIAYPQHFNKLITEIRVKNYAIRTEQSYENGVARYVAFHAMNDPAALDGSAVAAFLEYRVIKRQVSSSTQGQALCALVFFYKYVLEKELGDIGHFTHSKKPRRLPVVLSRAEITRLFSGINNHTHRLMANLLYGCGLRLLECARLRIFDIDFSYNHILVRNAKGYKEWVT